MTNSSPDSPTISWQVTVERTKDGYAVFDDVAHCVVEGASLREAFDHYVDAVETRERSEPPKPEKPSHDEIRNMDHATWIRLMLARRAAIEASGIPMFSSWEEIEREVADRRGGINDRDADGDTDIR